MSRMIALQHSIYVAELSNCVFSQLNRLLLGLIYYIVVYDQQCCLAGSIDIRMTVCVFVWPLLCP